MTGAADTLLTPGPVADLMGDEAARVFETDLTEDVNRKLRRAGPTGRPLGAPYWIKAPEARTGLALAQPRRGRPPRERDAEDGGGPGCCSRRGAG